MRKLVLRHESIRVLHGLHIVRGGQSEGAACDNTQGATKCDLAGCNPFCTGSCNACDPPLSPAQSCQGCTND